jgi:hypothetical protein
MPEVSAVHWFISEAAQVFLLFFRGNAQNFIVNHSDTNLIASVNFVTAVNHAEV